MCDGCRLLVANRTAPHLGFGAGIIHVGDAPASGGIIRGMMKHAEFASGTHVAHRVKSKASKGGGEMKRIGSFLSVLAVSGVLGVTSAVAANGALEYSQQLDESYFD